MGHIDILIPLAAGLFLIFSPEAFIKPEDPAFPRKKSRMQKAGFGLTIVAFLYAVVKFLS